MRNQWKLSRDTLGGFLCIRNDVTGELCLFGEYGEIWQKSEYEFGAIIYSNRVANKNLPIRQHPKDPQDETLIRFPAQDLALWVLRLKVPVKSKTQADLANRRDQMASTRSSTNESNGENLRSWPQDQRREPPCTPTLDATKNCLTTDSTENPEDVLAKKKGGE